jgi:hypothetical protein
MRRLLLVMAAAALMAAMMAATAATAFADAGGVPGHCAPVDGDPTVNCAGGSGGPGGGGGGQIEFFPGIPTEFLSQSTGGSGGPGGGSGGTDCTIFFGTDLGCAHGKNA